jgi:hypothetical protein
MLFLRKLLKLPSPIDLGWSDHNALEDEEFSENPQGKTWQDWDRTVKKMHPVKYWIAETAADWLRYKVWFRIARPFSDAYYWLVSHLVPSRRYHMLDLRQNYPQKDGKPDKDKCYRYGWNDVPEKMMYAMFNLLGQYLDEGPTDLSTSFSSEEIQADAGLLAQQEALIEARAIYHWWTVERHETSAHRDEVQDQWWKARKAKDPKKEEYWLKLKKFDADIEAKEEEMIVRLMKIRRGLWT